MSPSLPTAIVLIFDNVALTKYFFWSVMMCITLQDTHAFAIGFTIVLYDTLLTLSDEVSSSVDLAIVKSFLRGAGPPHLAERWNLVKALFYAVSPSSTIVTISIGGSPLALFRGEETESSEIARLDPQCRSSCSTKYGFRRAVGRLFPPIREYNSCLGKSAGRLLPACQTPHRETGS